MESPSPCSAGNKPVIFLQYPYKCYVLALPDNSCFAGESMLIAQLRRPVVTIAVG